MIVIAEWKKHSVVDLSRMHKRIFSYSELLVNNHHSPLQSFFWHQLLLPYILIYNLQLHYTIQYSTIIR